MAVPKSRTSRAKRGSRRTHDQLKSMALSFDDSTGEEHLRHHMTVSGFYRGKDYSAKE